MAKPPSLPFITQAVLPGEGWVPGTYRLHGPATIFDTWRPARRVIARLAAGTKVTLLSGLNRINKPDVLKVTAPVHELGLNPGDTLLRYLQRGEGDADFWAKGYWYADGDLGWVQNADGSGCQRQCKGREIEVGQAEWWFEVRLADRRIGWTNAGDSINPN